MWSYMTLNDLALKSYFILWKNMWHHNLDIFEKKFKYQVLNKKYITEKDDFEIEDDLM